MIVQLIQIGNSEVLPISKAILDKYNIKDNVELILEEEQIVLRPVVEARKGWRDSFKQMAERNGDKLIIDDVFEDENFD